MINDKNTIISCFLTLLFCIILLFRFYLWGTSIKVLVHRDTKTQSYFYKILNEKKLCVFVSLCTNKNKLFPS